MWILCILQGGYIFRSSQPLALLRCCFCFLNLNSQYCNWKCCWWVCLDIEYSKEDTIMGAASQWCWCSVVSVPWMLNSQYSNWKCYWCGHCLLQRGYIYRNSQSLLLMRCCFCSLNLKLTILQRKVLLVGVCGYCILQGGYIYRSCRQWRLGSALSVPWIYIATKSVTVGCVLCMDIAYSKEDTFIWAVSQLRLCTNQLCCNEY